MSSKRDIEANTDLNSITYIPTFPEPFERDNSHTTASFVSIQIRLLVASVTEENFLDTEHQIYYLLQRGSFSVYISYWKLLIQLFVNEFEAQQQKRDLNLPFRFDFSNLVHRLLYNLAQELITRTPDTIEKVKELALPLSGKYPIRPLFLSFLNKDNESDSAIIEALNPEVHPIFTTLKDLHRTNMSVSNITQNLFAVENKPNFLTMLSEFLKPLQGETLNDWIALILSEILAPGSQTSNQPSQPWIVQVPNVDVREVILSC